MGDEDTVSALLNEFLDGLASEEAAIAMRLTVDALGLSLRVAVNELDWYLYNYAREAETTREQNQHYYIMSLGVTRLISVMFRAHADFSVPTITLRRQIELSKQILEIAAHLGFIEHGRRNANMVRAGLSRLIRNPSGRYEFILLSSILDEAAHERDVEAHFRHETRRLRQELLESAQGQKIAASLTDLLEENVFVFAEHFMGYDAHPMLDEHYFQLAWSELRETPGFDSFNELRTFGGICFLKYLLGAAYLNSLCLKHEAFSRAMTRKHPGIRMEDILSITSVRAEFVSTMRDALNIFGLDYKNYTMINLEEAWRIYDVLAITRRNVDLLDRPLAPLPCLVEFSDSAVIKFVAGRHRQMEFLLNSLRRAFPREYDGNQRFREGSLQRALEKLLGDAFPGLEFRRNVKLRCKGRVLTDVDLAVIDRRFGDLFLVQIKFQDRPSQDFRTEASRVDRFRTEAVRWLSTVDQWRERGDAAALKSTFRVPRDLAITRIRKLVLARHHAWPLRNVQLDDDTAYATWDQFVNAVMLMEEQQGDFRTLNGLFGILRSHIVGIAPRHHEDEEPVEFVLNNLKFAVLQESGGRAGG